MQTQFNYKVKNRQKKNDYAPGIVNTQGIFLCAVRSSRKIIIVFLAVITHKSLFTPFTFTKYFLLCYLFVKQHFQPTWSIINGCGMGPLLVLVSPCLWENVVVTCKSGSFLCSLDNLLQKNVIVFFFENQISKWHSFKRKRAIFDLLFTFFSHQGKVTKIPSAHISLTFMYFAHPINFFCLPNFEKNTNLSGMISLWCDSCVDSDLRHFGTINK